MNKKYILIISIIIVFLMQCTYSIFATEITETLNSGENSNTELVNQTENSTPSLGEQKQKIEQEIEQKNMELEYVQTEMSTTLQKTLELQDKIDLYQEDIQTIADELVILEENINSTEENLGGIETKYQDQEKLLKKRLVAVYQAGETTYLDVLLQSSNIIDFISNYYLIQKITEYDTTLLHEIDEQKKSIEIIKEKLEQDKAILKVKRAKQMKLSTIMQNDKAMQIIYLGQLTEQEVTLKASIDEYKIEEDRIEYLIEQSLAATSHYGLTYAGGIMAWPVIKEGSFITSDFGIREHPITGVIKKHTGIDISGGYGVPVIAATDGIVSYSGWLGGYGNCVIIDHGGGVSTLYGHGQSILTATNNIVKRGDLIMEMGSSGNSTGPHLHFEVRINRVPTNPIEYLQ